MKWVMAIQQAITYIEKHLMENINYEAVAKQVYMSGYEFHRAFSFLTGMTVTAYIRNRRLSLAGVEIIETDSKITDIALKYGYETPESFTKAFTRFHGVSPKMAREESGKLALFNPLVIKISVEGGNCMDYKIVQTKQQKFLAVVGRFSNDIINDETNHEIPDFWDKCMAEKCLAPLLGLRPAGKRDLYGLCSPSKAGEESFEYGIGVRIDEATLDVDLGELLNKDYRIWDVKPGTYVVFDCFGENGDCISDTWAKFYQEFLPQMGYEAAQETDYEIYFEQGRKGLFCELWIPIVKMQ